MRQADDATLLADGAGCLDSTETGRHDVLQEQTDDVAVASADLLAHDDLKVAPGQLYRALGAIDALMVGDGQVCQAQPPSALDHPARIGQRIEGGRAVGMQVREGPHRVRCAAPLGLHGLETLDQRVLEELEVLHGQTRAESDAVEGVLGDVAGHAGDLCEQPVDVAQQ